MSAIQKQRAHKRLALAERNALVMRRELVDHLFDIEYNELDPAKKIAAMKLACQEAQVYERLMNDYRPVEENYYAVAAE